MRKQHRPHGKAPTAWEADILKIRAFEMVLILFYMEDLRRFIMGSISFMSSSATKDAGTVCVKSLMLPFKGPASSSPDNRRRNLSRVSKVRVTEFSPDFCVPWAAPWCCTGPTGSTPCDRSHSETSL